MALLHSVRVAAQTIAAQDWIQSRWILGLLVAVGLLLTWRLWSFTVKPLLFRSRPLEYPYWIPVFGHASAFVNDGQNLISKAREYFGDQRLPFFLTVGGQRLYIFTSPEDVALVYKDTTSFTFDEAVADLTHTFGVSKAGVASAYRAPTSLADDALTKAGYDNPKLKCLAHLNEDYMRRQLHPGQQLEELNAKFVGLLEDYLCAERLTDHAVISRTGSTAKVSLYKWSQDVLLNVASRAFFGEELLQLNPNLFDDFMDFDEDNWKMWYKMPGAGKTYAARDRLIATIEKYIAIPRQHRKGMSPIIEYYEGGNRAIGLTERETATIITMIYFVTNTNTFKLTFWMLTYLLRESTLLDLVRGETNRAFDEKGSLSVSHLLDHCPWLNAALDETLRLCSATASARTSTRPIFVRGKKIPAGAKIICPFRELHHYDKAWGIDHDEWNPKRFAEKQNARRSPSYRPFGGGISYCPGRFIARTEALVFCALLLQRFDVELAGQQSFPSYDTRPNPGLMAPVPGHDTILNIKW